MTDATHRRPQQADTLPTQPISAEVLLERYAKGSENSADDVRLRVARALAAVEAPEHRAHWASRFLDAQRRGFVPAGRIASAAGTDLAATLINCFVQPVGDSIIDAEGGFPGICTALAQAAETMRRGGGVGYDFSRIRPAGAAVASTASSASGPVSHLRVFDRSGETVASTGSRRGAQMGVLRCDHPDIETFIHAKDEGDLKNFTLSVGVTDAFMQAVVDGGEIELVHKAEPGLRLKAAGAHQRADGLWVYRRVPARALWGQIMRATYDHAEPGVLFLDRINADNNLGYCETIAATNPCVTADTWVQTSEGPRQVADLVGRPFEAIVDGRPHRTGSAGFFPTGRKPVLRLRTREGHVLRLTPDHPVRRVVKQTRHLRHAQWCAAGALQPGDAVVLHDHRRLRGWPGHGTAAQGGLLGLLIGGGHLDAGTAVLPVAAPALQMARGCSDNGPAAAAQATAGVMREAGPALAELAHRADFGAWQRAVGRRGACHMASTALRDLAFEMGMAPGHKAITPRMEAASAPFCRGLLRGLFDTGGLVQGRQDTGISVRLTLADSGLLHAAQRILLRLGVASTVCRGQCRIGGMPLPDGRSGQQAHLPGASDELVISGDDLPRFAEQVGFADTAKSAQLGHALAVHRRAPSSEGFVATVESLAPDGLADVFDVTVADVHAFDANGLMVHNCAEQPLPPHGCCCLGSIDLTRFIREPFADAARFDETAFAEVCAVAVRMLDNVLDVTVWPLPEQRAEAMAKRRVGLGFTGLGDALVMLGLRYDSEPAREAARRIAELMRNAAYSASSDLAAERGAFPRFDRDLYLGGGRFASRLPAALKEKIRHQGIRNSHLLSIAPTGTISLAFADNASNGIEPAFSWTCTRRRRMPDGTPKACVVEDHAWRLYRHLKGAEAPLTQAFVTALELRPQDHAAMVAAVAPLVDTSISKTVNVPADCPYDDFRDLYLNAWQAGLKGLATYRPNTVIGAVLSTSPRAATWGRVDDGVRHGAAASP